MQRTELISVADVEQILETIFKIGEATVFESYSEMEKDLILFRNIQEINHYLRKRLASDPGIVIFCVYYPETRGYYKISKIMLNPKYCDGKTFRYKMMGWGLIQVELDYRKSESTVGCRISVNSEQRAKNWESTCPELKSPTLWDWKAVNSKAGKLIYQLKKLV